MNRKRSGTSLRGTTQAGSGLTFAFPLPFPGAGVPARGRTPFSSNRTAFRGPSWPKVAAVVAALALGGTAGPARAQILGRMPGSPVGAENIEGLTVAGKGSVSARPNLVEVDLEVSAASELTADAIVKYRDARRRLHDAFTALKLANVAVEERGLLVDQKGQMNPYYFGGYQPNTRNKTEVQLARKLVVKASDIRGMDEEKLLQLVAKLLDVAQDAGARIGRQPTFNRYYYDPYERFNQQALVRFVVDDFDTLQEEAYQKAIADARTRAERLARLSQVELGPIVAVREVAVPGELPGVSPAHDEEDSPRKHLETARFQAIPVRVELLVRFEVHPHPEGKPRTGER